MSQSLPLSYMIKLFASDDKPFTIRWKGEDGAYRDLTGWTAKLEIRKTPCGEVELDIDGVIDAPETGEIVYPISSAQREAIVADCGAAFYHHKVFLTSPAGALTPLLYGRVRIEK